MPRWCPTRPRSRCSTCPWNCARNWAPRSTCTARVGVPPVQVAAVAIGDSEPDAAEIDEVPQIPAIIARLDPRTAIRAGEHARVHVDLDSLHFFDPATGDSLRD